MYDLIYCSGCGRNIYNCKLIIEKVKDDKKDEIMKTDQFMLSGETIDFPITEVIQDLQLRSCCVADIITYVNINNEYYMEAVDR